MNADTPGASGQRLWFRLSRTGEIAAVTGDTRGVLGLSSTQLWQRQVADLFGAEAAAALEEARAGEAEGPGATRLIRVRRRDGQVLDLRLTINRNQTDGGFDLRLAPVPTPKSRPAPEAEFEERFDDAMAFLDHAAGTLADGRGDRAITLIAVDGGRARWRDAAEAREFRRIVDAEASRLGASGTAELEDGAYGVVHGLDYDSEALIGSIGREASARGVLDGVDELSATRVDPDGTNLDALKARGTLGHVLGRLRHGLVKGLGRVDLGEAHDAAHREAKAMIRTVEQAIKAKSFSRRLRPVIGLMQQGVAIHQIDAFPVVDGRPFPMTQVFDLVEADRLHAECELGVIEQAILFHRENRERQTRTPRVMASIRNSFLREQDIRRRIDRLASEHGIAPHDLIIRPHEPLTGALNGGGQSLMKDVVGSPWTLSLPDFAAFVAGDAKRRESVEAAEHADAYIEVPADRLLGVAAAKDGAFLVKGLVESWRARRIELIATAIASAAALERVEGLGVHYVSGRQVGGWEQLD